MPSREYLNECFDYNPVTGELLWKRRPSSHFTTFRSWINTNSRVAGKPAGSKQFTADKNPAAICVKVNDVSLIVSRVIYTMLGVAIPEGMEIDHEDTNPFNNAWKNLRLATRAQNCFNRGYSKNSGLPKGVYVSRQHVIRGWKKAFWSSIMFNGEVIQLGAFDTPEEAHAAYCAKSKELHGDFARFN